MGGSVPHRLRVPGRHGADGEAQSPLDLSDRHDTLTSQKPDNSTSRPCSRDLSDPHEVMQSARSDKSQTTVCIRNGIAALP